MWCSGSGAETGWAVGEENSLGMIAVVLRHGMPIAQTDLALLVAASVFCSPVGVRLSKSGTLRIPPVVVLTDPTPMQIIGNRMVVSGLDILDGSKRAP